MLFHNSINKCRREFYKFISNFCLKQVESDYYGLSLKVPVIQGVGTGFLVPADKWMSDCLSVFLKLKKGAVVDIGVNIGLYLVKLKAIDASREYIGFEPNAVCNNYTQELIRVNEFKKSRVFPYALSNTKELRRFYIVRKADKMGSLNDYARFGELDKSQFDLVTFPADEVMSIISPDSICVLKIDVEGSESEVLQGLKETIKKYSPFLYCEIWQLPEKDHPTYKIKYEKIAGVFKLMGELDYKILGVSGVESKKIDVLESVEMFTGMYKQDYIMVHKSELEVLSESFAQQ